ncbi:hypothetical protein PG985_013618 [Apiospora marii]|uniref:Antifungal protein n=1 Tax=Apiospora marii TaxID=335849 RepID=A0ABR1R7E4_9PEZI
MHFRQTATLLGLAGLGLALPTVNDEDATTITDSITAILPPKPAIISQTFPAPPTPIVTPTISTAATPTLATKAEEHEDHEEVAEAFDKLREGKCTGPNGNCHIRVHGIMRHKDCEQGTRCSAKGTRCFMSGHGAPLRHYISCV